MAGFQLAGPAADVPKSLYGENRKSYQSPNAQCDNFLPPRSPTAKVQYVVDRVGPRPIPGLGSSYDQQTEVIALRVWALVRFAKITIQTFRHICSRTCQLESSHLGTKIAITFAIFTFRRRFLSQIV